MWRGKLLSSYSPNSQIIKVEELVIDLSEEAEAHFDCIKHEEFWPESFGVQPLLPASDQVRYQENPPPRAQVLKLEDLMEGRMCDGGAQWLRFLLNGSERGQEILAKVGYSCEQRLISNKDRYVVSRIVIDEALKDFPRDKPPQISGRCLSRLATACGKLFDEDPSLWYRKENKRFSGHLPNPGKLRFSKPRTYGILLDRYESFKHAWRKANPQLNQLAIEERKAQAAERKRLSEHKKAPTDGGPSPPEAEVPHKRRGRPRKPPDTQASQEATIKESWEKLLLEPSVQELLSWEDFRQVPSSIQAAFKASARARLNLVSLPIEYPVLSSRLLAEYVNRFRFFTFPASASQLINWDFQELFPQVRPQQLLLELLRYADVITKLAESGSCSNLALKFTALAKDKSQELWRQGEGLLLALPFATKRSGLRNKPGIKRSYCVSRADAADRFVSFVRNAEEKEELHQARREENSLVQPYVVVIGSHLDVQRCYVRFLDVEIPTNTILDAVDLCFKAFFVFNLKFPSECLHLWIILQELLYGISCSGQQTTASARLFIETAKKLVDSVEAEGRSSDEKGLDRSSRKLIKTSSSSESKAEVLKTRVINLVHLDTDEGSFDENSWCSGPSTKGDELIRTVSTKKMKKKGAANRSKDGKSDKLRKLIETTFEDEPLSLTDKPQKPTTTLVNKCSACNKAYRNKIDLIVHMRYKCEMIRSSLQKNRNPRMKFQNPKFEREKKK